MIRYSYIGDSQFDRPALDEIFKIVEEVQHLSEDG
ncbi:hypothetical protein J2S25_000574 [Mesobacillus stamsii]|uniref:HAD family hydrolase n=1 Tax=Mesobacillus stamsii TaxID=225347 RepID=A0ABU0FR58_9BACI|nr:hypothetical protein [Mesobacillus stamsii]